MKKLSIFVEGQTELIFVRKLVIEIAGHKHIDVELKTARGGAKTPRVIQTLESIKPNKKYYIQIIDCGNDNKVVSDIRDNSLSLEQSGFEKILGLRDVYPEDKADLQTMIEYSNLYSTMDEVSIKSKIIFAVMEVETWFLKEYSYLDKINPLLVKGFIMSNLGYDLENDDLENDSKYFHPAQVLNEIYNLVGRSYDKKKKKIDQLVESLNYERLYLDLANELNSLNIFIKELDAFFI